MAQMVKNLPEMQETWVRSLGWEDPLEEGMATHSSILAWRIPWTEKPGGLQSITSPRVGHDWVTKHNSTASFKFSCIFFQKGKRHENCRILSISDHKTLQDCLKRSSRGHYSIWYLKKHSWHFLPLFPAWENWSLISHSLEFISDLQGWFSHLYGGISALVGTFFRLESSDWEHKFDIHRLSSWGFQKSYVFIFITM